jgi:CBS domain containing-hemolysin-like protein
VAGLVLQVLGRVPASGDIAEVVVPDPTRDDEDGPRERMVTLIVEHMDGLRIDRLTLRVLEPDQPAQPEEGEQ